jgi:5-methylcytosine-specific restriction endonuclease McrA
VPVDRTSLEKVLGRDYKSWPRNCLITYPPELDRLKVAGQIIAAMSAAKTSPQDARRIIQSIDSNGLKRFFIDVAQHAGSWRFEHNPKQMEHQPVGATKRSTPPRKQLLKLFSRDNYRCRYCGTPIVGDRKQFVALAEQLSIPELVVTGGNEARHGLYLTFRGSHDHLVPLAEGGTNDMDNLLTACWPCQFGKFRFSLDDLRIQLRKGPYPFIDQWASIMDVSRVER